MLPSGRTISILFKPVGRHLHCDVMDIGCIFVDFCAFCLPKGVLVGFHFRSFFRVLELRLEKWCIQGLNSEGPAALAESV